MRSKKWTHHHFIRSYHFLTFSVSAVTVAFFAWSLGIALTVVRVSTSNAPVYNEAVLGESTNTPSTTVDSGNESAASSDRESNKVESKITVVPGESIQQRYVLRDGEVQPIFIFPTQYPKFRIHKVCI